MGDYIDRGNDSKGVIDFILQLRQQNYQVHTLRGNYEQMMMNSVHSDSTYQHWLKSGGDITLASFGVKSYTELKPVYKSFFKRTKFFIQTKNLLLVHTGLNLVAINPLSDKYSMLWARDFYIENDFLKQRLLIHGHTPKQRDVIIAQKIKSPINLDGGCVYNKLGYGNLYALDVIEKRFIEVENME